MQSATETEVMARLHRQLDYIERGGQVQRMHMIPTLHPQSVAAHSFGVAWWCWLLSHNNEPSATLLMAALQHDLPEGATGDIPSPTKYALGVHSKLSEWEAELNVGAAMPDFEPLLTENESRLLRLCDVLELMQHCVRERQLGNRRPQLDEMLANVEKYAREISKTNLEYKVIQHLYDQWRSA